MFCIAVSKQQEGSSIPTDVEISPDLIQALVQQQLGPNDIEVLYITTLPPAVPKVLVTVGIEESIF